jgi:hypothetical protein
LDLDFLCRVEPLSCWALTLPPSAFASVALPLCDRSFFGMCLAIPADPKGGIFGFSEFVQAFALLILVYTMSDVRYRFRASTAPIPIWTITFWASAFIGLGTITSDLWFANKYPLPLFLTSQPYWQLAFGLMFLSVVMLWLWYAFLRPPTFNRMNPRNFARQLYLYVLQGAEADLPIIANELRRSAWNIIKYAPENPPRHLPPGVEQPEPMLSVVSACAYDILLIIGSRKFCRHIVASAPITAIAFFQAMTGHQKYRLPIGSFAANISSEALLNKDSILYHEDEGYYSGYLGYTRPFTNAVYGDFRLVEALSEGSSPLDIDLDVRFEIDSKQLEAYCRAVLTTLRSALEAGHFYNHSFAIYRALHVIRGACADVYKLDDGKLEPSVAKDIGERLRVVVKFIDDTIKIFGETGIQRTILRHRGEEHRWLKDYYDHIADLMFEVVYNVSTLKNPGYDHWSIQYSTVWSQIFGFHDTPARKIILFKLRRLLYEEVLRLEKFPNFKSAPMLGYLLNVMGLKPGQKKDYRSQEYPLRKAVISWTRRKYLWLVKKQHFVAESVLRSTITFDARNKRLVKTYNKGLSLKPQQEFLALDPFVVTPPKSKRQRV